MMKEKHELFRHLLATLAFRGGVAISNASEEFATFRIGETTRTPAEILVHIGDCVEGSLALMQGNFIFLDSKPLPWHEEIARFFSKIKEFDDYLATDKPLAQPIEKIMQGPIADSLTHVGQIIMLRRLAGFPVKVDNYFAAEIVAGEIDEEYFEKI